MSSTLTRPDAPPLSIAHAVVEFWRDAGPEQWFAKDPGFDQLFTELCLKLHERAASGELRHWERSARGSLALVLLLDQFPRHAFRGTARMYATDDQAREVADAAIAAGFDERIDRPLRLFLYLPFAHSERLEDQERSVALCDRLDERSADRARHHRDIVRRFGRFPHRNLILRRHMTKAEQAFLDGGGFAG